MAILFNTGIIFSLGSPNGQSTDRLPEDAYLQQNGTVIDVSIISYS